MASQEETFVLVELGTMEDSTPLKRDIIKRVVRTYLSRPRADEDLLLLRDAASDKSFNVVAIEHIDD